MLLDPEVRRSADELDLLLDAEFTEIGASGRTWTRVDLINELIASPHIDGNVVVAEMAARHVTADVIVVEYRTSTRTRDVHRSSWWRKTDGRWRCYFHQGTLLPGR